MSRHALADQISDTITVGEGDRAITVHEDTDLEKAALEKWLAGTLGSLIQEQYPTRQWAVRVDVATQVVIVQCPDVSVFKGYHIPVRDMTMHDLGKKAVWAAGHILERHGLSRNKFADRAEIATLPTNPVRPTEVDVPDAAPELIHGV